MATALVPQSPLMQQIDYHGQPYFTSQYFHAQYLANSPHGGKYRRHAHFVRALRGIEAYRLYVQQTDIVELEWSTIKLSNDVGNPEWVSLKSLFHSLNWNPLTLLNATAQLALSHHLDDLVSQQMSVAVNRSAARKHTDSLPDELATRTLAARLEAGKLLGVPMHLAQQEAVKAVLAATGVDYRSTLALAPGQDIIPDEAVMLEPTDLARVLGLSSGAAMNATLAALGWQVRAIGGGWEPTPTGQPHCTRHAWASNHSSKSGYNLKWSRAAVADAIAKHSQAGTP